MWMNSTAWSPFPWAEGSIPGCSWDAFCLDLETFSAVAKLPIFQLSKQNTAHAMDGATATRSDGAAEGGRCWSPSQPQPLLVGCRHGRDCGTRQAPTQAPSELSRSFPSVRGKDLKASLIINCFALFSPLHLRAPALRRPESSFTERQP